MMAPELQSQPLLICLIGAECTGKTTLAQALAARMDGLWVPEYLREFTDRHGRTPQQQEQLHIVQQHVLLETQALERARQQHCAWVFCDTSPLLTAVYSDCVFGDASLYPQAQALHARYTLTLLLEPDLPWQADGRQRDGVEMRAKVHTVLEHVLAQHDWPVVRITGSQDYRLQAAVQAVLRATQLPAPATVKGAGSG